MWWNDTLWGTYFQNYAQSIPSQGLLFFKCRKNIPCEGLPEEKKDTLKGGTSRQFIYGSTPPRILTLLLLITCYLYLVLLKQMWNLKFYFLYKRLKHFENITDFFLAYGCWSFTMFEHILPRRIYITHQPSHVAPSFKYSSRRTKAFWNSSMARYDAPSTVLVKIVGVHCYW